MTEAPDTPKSRLLAATIEHVAEQGVAGLTLRALAEAIGTSHRMLIYHFGSKEELLVEVVRAVERRQRDTLAELDLDTSLSTLETMRRLWGRVADPELWPYERLFFELYGQALQDRPGTTGLLDGIVDAWLVPLIALGRKQGLDPDEARANARLLLGVTRGLLLDLLATGDRAAVDEALERFVALYQADLAARPASPDGASTAPAIDQQVRFFVAMQPGSTPPESSQ
ncbi:MAG: TetR/AcrR family transcriptional regulator [Solirubrobacteraceae bacterium]